MNGSGGVAPVAGRSAETIRPLRKLPRRTWENLGYAQIRPRHARRDDIAEIQDLRRAIKQVLGTVSNPDHAVSTLLLLITETIRQAPPEDRKALFVDMTGRIWRG